MAMQWQCNGKKATLGLLDARPWNRRHRTAGAVGAAVEPRRGGGGGGRGRVRGRGGRRGASGGGGRFSLIFLVQGVSMTKGSRAWWVQGFE